MIYLIWILGIVILDQLIKVVVIKTIAPQQIVPIIQGVINLTYVRNPGGAFGILSGYGFWVTIVTLVVSFSLLLMLFFGDIKDGLVRVGLTIIIGGAGGNLIDRLMRGYVVDFIDFRMFPVFNLADVAIVIGTGLIFLTLLKRAKF